MRSPRVWGGIGVGGAGTVVAIAACSTFGSTDPDPAITTTADGSADAEAGNNDVTTSPPDALIATRGPRCGAVRCLAGQVCCFDDAGAQGVCVANGDSCLAGRAFRCSGRSTCAAAGKLDEKCCATYQGAEQLGQSFCAVTCGGPTSVLRELCELDEPSDCTAPRSCFAMPTGYDPKNFSECLGTAKDAGITN